MCRTELKHRRAWAVPAVRRLTDSRLKPPTPWPPITTTLERACKALRGSQWVDTLSTPKARRGLPRTFRIRDWIPWLLTKQTCTHLLCVDTDEHGHSLINPPNNNELDACRSLLSQSLPFSGEMEDKHVHKPWHLLRKLSRNRGWKVMWGESCCFTWGSLERPLWGGERRAEVWRMKIESCEDGKRTFHTEKQQRQALSRTKLHRKLVSSQEGLCGWSEGHKNKRAGG